MIGKKAWVRKTAAVGVAVMSVVVFTSAVGSMLVAVSVEALVRGVDRYRGTGGGM